MSDREGIAAIVATAVFGVVFGPALIQGAVWIMATWGALLGWLE